MNAFFRPLRNLAGGLLAFLLPLAAWAQNSGNPNSVTLSVIREAAQRDGDKSREALVSIFGEVVKDPLAIVGGSGDTVLASIFMVTNGAILVIGAIFACYIFFQRLSNTAHDGAVFDRDKVTLWEPIRIVWGIATLVPTANGWSLAQLLMLWAASIIGIGVANLGVDAAMKAFDDGKSMVVQPVSPSTKDLARNLFIANLCMHGINKGIELEAIANGMPFEEESRINYVPKGEWAFDLENKNGFNCANVSLSSWEARTSAGVFNGIIGYVVDSYGNKVGEAHKTATYNMQNSLTEDARKFVNAVIDRKKDPGISLISAKKAIDDAAFRYEATVNKVAQDTGKIEELSKIISDSISDGGWWMIGAWYQTFAQANSKLLEVVAARANISLMSSTGDSGTADYIEDIIRAYENQMNEDLSKQTSTSGSGQGKNSSVVTDTENSPSDLSKVIKAVFSPFSEWMVDMFSQDDQQKQINPLIQAKDWGDRIMGGSEIAIVIYGAITSFSENIKETTESWWAKILGKIPGPGTIVKAVNGAAKAAVGVGKVLGPFVLGILIALFFFGALLSIYIPLLPFIIWFGGIVNWMIVVGEAVVAAPLWALIHLGGEGDGFGHKTGHGYIFLLNCMVRPILMVIAFFFAGAALIVGGRFLNETFGIAIGNVQFDSTTGVFSFIGFLAVYCGVFIGMIHTCFNLIFVVPDQVINWVGGTAAPRLGQDFDQKGQGMFVALADRARHLKKHELKPKLGNPNKKSPGVLRGR